MQGSLYPDGVTVDRVALRRTELTKAAEILRNRNELSSGGILTGDPVVVNTFVSPNLRIDVPAFSGIAPNGEFVDVPNAILNQPLATNISGELNIVCAVYTEVDTHTQPHESNGRVYPVRSVASYRLKIFTVAEYTALPLTDTNLANDAQDRCLVRAYVVSNGSSSLTASSIQMPLEFGNFRYTVPALGVLITGVEFRDVSSGTPRGVGTLSYKYTAAPESYKFGWTTSTVAPVANVTVDSDGRWPLPDQGATGESVSLEISLSTLPKVTSGDYTWSETFQIEDLYYQEIPRFTGEDILHRSMRGTGAYSPGNPHRQTLNDLSGDSLSLLDEHQNVHHTNGIWRGSRSSVLSLAVDPTGSVDKLIIDLPDSNDLYYVNGVKKTRSNTDTAGDLSFATPADLTTYYYEVYVTDQGLFSYLPKVAFPVDRQCNGCWVVNMSENYPSSAAAQLEIVALSSSWTFSWQNGPIVSLGRDIGYQTIRLYPKNNEQWIDLCVNTEYNGSGGDKYLQSSGTAVDSDIVIKTSLTDGNDSYMLIGGVPYWYYSLEWIMGWNPPEGSRYVTDLRSWGTLGPENLSTKVYDELLYAPISEQGRSGVLKFRTKPIDTFKLNSLSLTSNYFQGGVLYCRGRRVSVRQTSVTFSSSRKYLVWCDWRGQIISEDITGGTLQEAMLMALGGSLDRPTVTDTYQSWDSSDVPERGVLLRYIETGTTAVTLDVDMMQNVNQVSDPWSVGGPLPLSGRGAPCAYGNLFSAFAYAEYYSQYLGGCPTLHIQGPVSLQAIVTQPLGCNVEGRGGLVTLEGTLNERWRLSAGCKVSGVNFSCTDFAPSAAVFAMADRVVIEDCVASFAPDGYLCAAYRSFDATPVGYSDVSIRGNVITRGRLLYYESTTTPQPGYSFRMHRWNITDNTVKALVASSVFGGRPVIGMVQAKDSTISGNNIEATGDLHDVRAIWLYSPERAVSVINNHIYVGATSNNVTVVGIFVSGSDVIDAQAISVEGNIISRISGSEQGKLSGVVLYGQALRVKICNNQFEYLWYAIRLQPSTEAGMQGISVNDNAIGRIYGRPIEVDVGINSALEACSICRNEIQNCTYLPGLSPWTDFVAIMVCTNFGVGSPGYVRGLNVSGNNITDMSVGDNTVPIGGIKLWLNSAQTGAVGVQCVGNTIHNLFFTGITNFNIEQYGISVKSEGTQYVNSANISQNVVRYASKSKNADAIHACGILMQRLSFGVIDANLVDVTSPSTDTDEWLSTGIYMEDSRNSQISNNNLDCPGSGIACVSGESYMVSGNRIVVTGTGIYMNDTTVTSPTLIEGNNVCVYSKSDGSSIKPSSISPYIVGDSSYGFLNGSAVSSVYLKGNHFKVTGGYLGSRSAAVRLLNVTDMVLGSNNMSISSGTKLGIIVGELSAVFILLKPEEVTRLDINGCIISDGAVVDEMSTRSDANGLKITRAAGWEPSNSALTGSVCGNTFNTTHKKYESGVYESLNYENVRFGEPPTAAALSPYCIWVVLLTTGGPTVQKGHRSLLSFSGNMINAPLTGAVNDNEADAPVALVYLPLYGATYNSNNDQGCCAYPTVLGNDPAGALPFPGDNRVTWNGYITILGSLLGTPWGTYW